MSHWLPYDIPKCRYSLFSTICYSGHYVPCPNMEKIDCMQPVYADFLLILDIHKKDFQLRMKVY